MGEAPAPKPLISPRARTLAGIAVSIVLLWYAARNVDFGKAWQAMSGVDFSLYAVSMLLYLATMAVRSLVIITLLGPHGRVTIGNALPNLVIGYFANNILPLKVGEIVRTALIAREARIPFLTGLSALVVERSLDVLSLLVIALAISFFLELPREVIVSVRVAGIVLAVVYAGAISLALVRGRTRERIDVVLRRLPAGAWIVRSLDQLSLGLRAVGRPAIIVRTLFLVALFWTVAVALWYMRLRAFGLSEDPAAAGLVLLVVGLGVSIPSAPSYAGVMHACIVFVLGTLGVEPDRSFPFAVFLHALDFTFVAVLGLSIMSAKGIRMGALTAPDDPGEHPGR